METERIYSNIHMVANDTKTQFYPRVKAWEEVFAKAMRWGFSVIDLIDGSEQFHNGNVLHYDDKTGVQWSWEWRIDNV